MVDDVAQLEHSNNKYYASAFRYRLHVCVCYVCVCYAYLFKNILFSKWWLL